MAGERDLTKLCSGMRPVMDGTVYVYCSFRNSSIPDGLKASDVFFTFLEPEGLTAVVQKQTAMRLALPHLFEARLITLNVHSSLEAVGFLATISAALAAADIPCNVVSAYYHDHLFVPITRADEAVRLLEALRGTALTKPRDG
ncbi:ACT domain-containing protein [Paraburkholderia sediminicola]|uniref:ACT domain-containing protein n=1 Tax=Paraburkholderia sediminicola TaxID=458836 RepID=UPI0038B9F8FE